MSEEVKRAYLEGYRDGMDAGPEDRQIMDAGDIVAYFADQGKTISKGKAQSILRAVRLNYNGGLLDSASYITRAEFLAFLRTPVRNKVRMI